MVGGKSESVESSAAKWCERSAEQQREEEIGAKHKQAQQTKINIHMNYHNSVHCRAGKSGTEGVSRMRMKNDERWKK